MPAIITSKTRAYRDLKPPLGSTINWGNPLAQGMVGCWLMNEGGGNRALNLANGKTALPTGVPSFQPTAKGSSLYTSGATDLVSENPSFTIPASTPITVIVVAQTNAANTTRKRAIRLANPTNGTTFNIDFANGSENKIIFGSQYSYGSFADVKSTFTPAAKTFYNIVGVWRGSSLQLYINGQWNNTYAPTTASLVSNQVFLGNSSANFPLIGHLNYALVYNRVLSPSEIQQLYVEPYSFISRPSARRIFSFGTAAGGPTAWSQDCLEFATLTDIYSRQLSLIRTLSDSITLTDIAAFLGNSYTVTLLDSLTMNELRQRTLNRVLMEAVTLTEFMSKLIGRALLDALTLTEVVAALKLTVLVLSEQITTTDSIRKDIYRTILDVISASDSITTPQATFTSDQLEVLHLIDTLKYWVTRRQGDSSWSSITTSTGLWTPGSTGSGSWFNINDP